RKHLRELERLLSEIGIGDFTKYQALLAGIRENLQWNGRDSEDRLVIFTERIETLKFLDENLRKDLGLKDKQIAQLRGDMSDVDQQAVVERFGKGDDPLRLLIASDVASEGINLHYQCHKMIHFDIPWSLMVFQQRNGRIDRYGQKHTPFIVYLITESGHNKIRGDVRILELLIEKDEQAVRNIGDPSALMGVYNIQQEEDITARAIESGEGAQALEAAMSSPRTANMMELVMKEAQVAPSPDSPTGERFSLFADDYHYLKTALGHLQQGETLQVSFDDARNTVNLTPPKSLAHRLKRLPREMRPDRGEFVLTADRMQVQAAMDRARREESSWPDIQLLWSLHPMLLWLNDTVRAAFGRMEAPLLRLSSLKEDECFFLISGLLPNRKSHPLVYRWFGVGFESGEFREILPLEALLEKTELHRRDFANTGVNDPVPAEMPILLERALEKARSRMEEERVQYQTQMRPRLKDHLQRLSTLEQKQLEQAKINSETGKLSQTEYGRTQRQIARVFQNHLTWIEDTLETGDTPYLQVVAVMLGR
ncbi:MAG TPA: C-terminal helicase domain-containing protein, partial [Calditrichia bacterium]|nr:C-terminal helicase domain-containing protein [Calditrichia bacterium]